VLLDCVIYCAFYSILFRGAVFFRSRCKYWSKQVCILKLWPKSCIEQGNSLQWSDNDVLEAASRRRLLRWVNKTLQTAGRDEGHADDSMTLTAVNDLDSSWRDGVLLCRLVAALCRDCTRDVRRLNPTQRLRNCRLALQLANKHLQLPMVAHFSILVSIQGRINPLTPTVAI